MTEEKPSVPDTDESTGEQLSGPTNSPEKIRAADVKRGDRVLPLDALIDEPLDVRRIQIDGGAVIIVGTEKTWAGWRTDWVWRYPAAETPDPADS